MRGRTKKYHHPSVYGAILDLNNIMFSNGEPPECRIVSHLPLPSLLLVCIPVSRPDSIPPIIFPIQISAHADSKRAGRRSRSEQNSMAGAICRREPWKIYKCGRQGCKVGEHNKHCYPHRALESSTNIAGSPGYALRD